jgi:transposase InsO family protein
MPWKEATVMSQKEQFIENALKKDRPFKELCAEFKISRETGYKLLNRYEKEGLKGLESKSRAPRHSPLKTPRELEEKILKIRVNYPTWGGRKIYSFLLKEGVKDLPAPSTISDILKRNGYISKEESLKRQALGRFEREHANELWQMDFKGKFQLATKQSCFPLTIIDDHSRFSPCIKACANEQYLTVKERLLEVFEQYGLPKQFNVDNGNPWGNSQLFKHTKLTVWLMRLGIKVTHSRPRHPQTNGKLERFHRTLKKDVLSQHVITDFAHAQLLFDEWREIYNYQRPHQAINMLVPANRYKPSQRSMPSTLEPIEYNDDALVRKVRGNGHVSYNGNEYHVGEAFAGNQVELKLNPLGEEFDIYFHRFKIYTYNLKT